MSSSSSSSFLLFLISLPHLLLFGSCFRLSNLHQKHDPSPYFPKALSFEVNGMLGSNPPSCHNKCNKCHPCIAVQVPTMPTNSHNQNQNQPKTRPEMEDLDPSPSQSNYKPLGWKCRCGDHIFNP